MTMNIKESLVHWLGEIDDQIQINLASKSEMAVIHFLLLEGLPVNRNGQNFSDHAFAFRFCLAVRRLEESLPAWAPTSPWRGLRQVPQLCVYFLLTAYPRAGSSSSSSASPAFQLLPPLCIWLSARRSPNGHARPLLGPLQTGHSPPYP